MTKASAIMIAPRIRLRQLPPEEKDVLRRFFTEYVRGVDARHQKRWSRWARNLFQSEPGEGSLLYSAEERGGPFHRMHRAVLSRLFHGQERHSNEAALHDWLKLKCWFVNWIDGKPQPRSTSYDECSEDEIREFHEQMVDLLHQPWCQRYFWPHLNTTLRAEMVQTILKREIDSEEETP